jgi:hypothetical protein
LNRALAIEKKVLGPEHPDVAGTLNNLGNVYDDQGNYPLAEQALSRALAIEEKVQGPERPEVTRLSTISA